MIDYPQDPSKIAELMESVHELQEEVALKDQASQDMASGGTAGTSETPEQLGQPQTFDEILDSPESREDLDEYVSDYVTISLEDYANLEPDDAGDFVTIDNFTLAVDVTDLGIYEEDLIGFETLHGSSNVTAHHLRAGEKSQEIKWEAKPVKWAEKDGKKYLVYEVTGN